MNIAQHALAPGSNTIEAHHWPRVLAAYRTPSIRRSVLEIAITAVPLVGLWVAMWWSLSISYWLCALLALPAAGLMVRMFIIQHDCSHGSFFPHRSANDWVGRVIGVLTLTPHDVWRRTHAIHHASSGNLDRRGIGDVNTLTVREYRALPWHGRLGYRLYRNPLVLFILGPGYLFLLQQRLPLGLMRSGWQPWVSSMATNAGIVAIAGLLIWLVGLGPFLMVQLPISLIGATIGVWLFFVQHQFEDTTWHSEEDWRRADAALHGSSHYDLPEPLRWFTGNIGIHHVHHLCASVPFYRLPEVLRRHPELAPIGRLTLWESFRCVRLTLWDEARQRLVSFREARQFASV